MKKIFIIATLLLAFGTNVNAQDARKKEDRSTATMSKDEAFKMQTVNSIEELDKTVSLDKSFKNDLISLLYMRKEAMDNVNSLEDKKAVFYKYGQKMLSGLSEDQRKTLELKNPTLYKSFLEFKE
jgi:alpha-L-arabinofuranosidase